MLSILKKCRLQELETRGYIIVRNCIPSSQITLMNSEYTGAKAPGNENYNFVRKSSLKKEHLGDIPDFINQAIRLINNETNIKCDTLLEGYYWPTGEKGTLFPWHQDHEPYYMNELNYNYLNFYIMIRKEKPEHSNLALVPFDKLTPALRTLLEKRGGTQFGPGKNIKERILALGPYNKESFLSGIDIMDKHQFVMRDSMTGQVTPLDCNFEDIKELPHLFVGDMIIMRGDVIHRTGDNNCDRVALSLRCSLRSECVVDIDKVMSLSPINTSLTRIQPINTHKAKVMLMNKQWIDMLSIMSAQNIKLLNFADNPAIWEHGDWQTLTVYQKFKFLIWRIYYRYILNKLSTTKGTLFWWNDQH